MHPVIVGIDPGTTSAYAILDMNFHILSIKSKKNYGLPDLIADIYKFGKPIIVGTDKKDMPSFIKEFSQKTGAKVHLTSYDTKKPEKKSVVEGKGLLSYVHNVHETDALASAIYAYNFYEPVIRKVRLFAEKTGRDGMFSELLVKVIVEGKNLHSAAEELEKKPTEALQKRISLPQLTKEMTKEEREIVLLKNKIELLEYELKILKQENSHLKNKRIDIGKETKKIISFKEKRAIALEEKSDISRRELAKKDKIISKLNEFIVNSQNMMLIKKVKNLGEDFQHRQKLLAIYKGDLLCVEDLSINSASVIEELREKIKIIFFEKAGRIDLSDFILIKKPDGLIENKYFALIGKNELDAEIFKAISQRKKDKKFLQDILEDYKKDRMKQLI
ncbi:MAG: DUF460 domain-containing protein [archaeon]